MRLVKFTKNKNKKRRIIVGSIIGVILLIGGITIYRTFALYEERREFNVLKGQVPSFKSDITLAIKVNGTSQETIPAKGNYIVTVTCDNGATGEWDYNKWDVIISGFKQDTKCNVSFVSTTEDEMPNILDEIGLESVTLVYSKSGGSSSTFSLSYTATEDEFVLFMGGHQSSVSTDGVQILYTGLITAGGAHKYNVAIFKLSKGNCVSGTGGWGENRIYRINFKN